MFPDEMCRHCEALARRLTALERQVRVGGELLRAVEASMHFVENLDLLSGEPASNPWPATFDGYAALVAARADWLDANR